MLRLERQRVSLLADLALKLLPGVGVDLALALEVDLLPDHLLHDPMLQAGEVDEAHGAIALAGAEQRIRLRALAHPAELALSRGLAAFSVRLWDSLVQALGELGSGAELRGVDIDGLEGLVLVFRGMLATLIITVNP